MSFLFLIFSTTIFISCEKENLSDQNTELSEFAKSLTILDKSQIVKASQSDQLAYKRAHLKTLSLWMLEEGFPYLNERLGNQTNPDDDTFFIEDLYLEHIAESNISEDSTIRVALDAFKDLDNETWFPSVRLVKSDNTSSNPKLIAAVEDYDGSEEFAQGYIMGDNPGEIKDLEYDITETSIDPDLILAVVLDPCSTTTFVPASSMEIPCADPYSGLLTGPGSGGGNNSLVINKMLIKKLKEIWPFRPRISFKGYKLDNPQAGIYYECGEQMTSSTNCQDYSGRTVAELKRSYEDDDRTYNWKIESSSDLNQEIIYYVIFEYDGFPAGETEEIFPLPLNGASTSFKYRSWNSIYDSAILSQNSQYNLPLIYGFSADNSVIKYNLSSY